MPVGLTVNGQHQPLPEPASVAALLAAAGLIPGMAVVELNGMVLTRAEAARAALHEGDRVEIVRAVAGG